jgi:hypothetical protein
MIDPEIEANSEGEADPELTELAERAERLTARIQAGEWVDVENCFRHYPEWAKVIQKLRPVIHELAALGRVQAGDPGTSS